jgi:hypothetical protein
MMQDKALDTVTALLWKGITDARAKMTDQLQGDGMRDAATLHDTIDEIQAYIAAIDIVRGAPEQDLAEPVAAPEVVEQTAPTPVAPQSPTFIAATAFTPPLAASPAPVLSAMAVPPPLPTATMPLVTPSAEDIKRSIFTTVADDINSITRGFL